MEVSLIRGSSHSVEKPILLSNSSPSATPDEVVLAEQELDKCKHFTIRGFVSEVRKRNAKICWPFSMLNHTLDENVNTLPPIPVKKFRQWGCQSCLHETVAPETFIENGENLINQNDGEKNKCNLLLGDATKVSHHETKKCHRKSLQQSKESRLEGMVVQEDNSTHISNDVHCPLSCSDKKCDACPNSDSIKGGIRVTKGGYNTSKEFQNLRKPNVVIAEEEAYQTGEKGEGTITIRKNASDVSLLSQDTSKCFYSKRNRFTSVHQTGGSGTSDQIRRSLSFSVAVSDKQDQGLRNIGKRKESDSHVSEYRRMLGGDVTIPKDGGLPSPLTHMCHDGSNDSDEFVDEASDNSKPLIRNLLPSQDDVRKRGTHVEKSRPKKYRKMRALDDIMKGEELQNDEKNCISSENAGASGSGSIETLDASRQKDKKLNHGCHLIQNTEIAVQRKNGKEPIRNEGEGTYLIHWLKKMSKKSSLHKGKGEAKHINTAACTPKFATAEGLDLNLEYSGRGDNKQEIIGEKKQNTMPIVEVVKCSFMPQEDTTAQKGHIGTEDLQTKNLHSRSAGIITPEKGPHHKIETHDSIQKKASLINNKNKGPLVEDGTSGTSSPQGCKDSLGLQKQAVFQAHRKVKKKQNTMGMSEQEAVDDIPMDIIELLAKKQQERHVTSTKYDNANMSKLSETTGILNNENGWDYAAGAHESKVSGAANKCLHQDYSQRDIAGCVAGTSVRIKWDAECGSKAYHSCSRGKQYRHFDLNQEAPVCALAELHVPSPYIGLSVSGAQLSVVNSNRNHSPQNVSSNGMKMLDFCSDHMNETVSPWNLFGNVHDGSSGLLNGYPPHIFEQKVRSDFNAEMCLGVNLKTVSQNAAYQTVVKPSKGTAESSTSGGNLEAESFSELGNGYYSTMMWPVDLHNNVTVSALNLLRLMHPPACSGEPFHSSRQNDNTGGRSKLLGLQGDLGDSKVPSVVSGNCELAKQEGNLCKPLRPLPRVGILGPLLQKEITNTANNSTPTLGFGARNPSELSFQKTGFLARQSNELTSYNTIEKGKAEFSSLAPVNKVMNAQTSISPYERFGRIGSSILPPAIPRCYVANNNIGQVVTGSKDGAFQPVRSTCKMEECVLNRNPADFAMPDEDSEYMIGYQDTKTKDIPLSEGLQCRTHVHGQKQKMRKLNDLNHSRMSNKSSLC